MGWKGRLGRRSRVLRQLPPPAPLEAVGPRPLPTEGPSQRSKAGLPRLPARVPPSHPSSQSGKHTLDIRLAGLLIFNCFWPVKWYFRLARPLSLSSQDTRPQIPRGQVSTQRERLGRAPLEQPLSSGHQGQRWVPMAATGGYWQVPTVGAVGCCRVLLGSPLSTGIETKTIVGFVYWVFS